MTHYNQIIERQILKAMKEELTSDEKFSMKLTVDLSSESTEARRQ